MVPQKVPQRGVKIKIQVNFYFSTLFYFYYFIFIPNFYFILVLMKYMWREHCVKSIQIRVISGPYFPIFGLNTGKYGPEIISY